MAGKCLEFSETPVLKCIPLGVNVYYNDWGKGSDRLCTKAALVKQLLKHRSLTDAEAKKHFAPLIKAIGGLFVAYCRAWKQVVCQGNTCRVKKEVTCAKACSWSKASASNCSEKYCKGRFGAMACKESAMVF